MDIIRLIETKSSNGHKFILVVMDYFTKWVENVTFKWVTKKAVVDFVHSNINCWVLKVWHEMKGCDSPEELWLCRKLWVVVFMKSYVFSKGFDRLEVCAFFKGLWPFLKVVLFPKSCDLYPLMFINREVFSHLSTLNSSFFCIQL